MKLYTQDEVDKYVRAVLSETTLAVKDWFEFETDIVDKKTRKVLHDAEIDVKPNRAKLTDYIYPRLVKHGITFTNPTPAENWEEQ